MYPILLDTKRRSLSGEENLCSKLKVGQGLPVQNPSQKFSEVACLATSNQNWMRRSTRKRNLVLSFVPRLNVDLTVKYTETRGAQYEHAKARQAKTAYSMHMRTMLGVRHKISYDEVTKVCSVSQTV